MAKLGEALTEVLIPLAAVIGLGFAVLQWILVSRIRLSSEPVEKNGRPENLVGGEPEEDEEEGVDGPASVAKCAEIQSAISIGGCASSSSLWCPFPSKKASAFDCKL